MELMESAALGSVALTIECKELPGALPGTEALYAVTMNSLNIYVGPASIAKPFYDGLVKGLSAWTVRRDYWEERMASWAEQGKKFGYPQCCIDSFVAGRHFKRRLEAPHLKLSGTGYIPCEECNAKYSEQELADNINKTRDKTLRHFTTNRLDHLECEEG